MVLRVYVTDFERGPVYQRTVYKRHARPLVGSPSGEETVGFGTIDTDTMEFVWYTDIGCSPLGRTKGWSGPTWL